MVSLRSGKRASDNGTPSIEPQKKKVKAASRTAKSKTPAKAEAKVKDQTLPRKAAPAAETPNPKRDEPNAEGEADTKDEESRPKTPLGETIASSSNKKAPEKTPGRVGPIVEVKHGIEFNIAPFKGPKGQKVRKSWHEKEDEYTERVLETPEHPFHALEVCFKKGPKGSPTYDEAGFELDYKKVAEWKKPKPYNKAAMMRGMDKAVDRMVKEETRMAQLFWEPGAIDLEGHIDTMDACYWRDRVSKDLNIPWHKVGVPEFEKWDKLGFPKAKKGEYQNPTREEKDRIMRMMSGASLRK